MYSINLLNQLPVTETVVKMPARFAVVHSVYSGKHQVLEAVPACKNPEWIDFEKGLEKEVKFKAVLHKSEETKVTIGSFCFSPMPGCCGVVVSHFTFLEKGFRGTSYSQTFRELKDKVARDLGYSCVIMTTQMENIPAVKNMFKRNFTVAGTFTNKRTGNCLGLGWKRV